jgi:hypothetical protein
MPDSRLLKSQKNDVFTAIRNAGLETSEFRWDDVASPEYGVGHNASQLTHTPTDFFFIFDATIRFGLLGVYSPGTDMRVEKYSAGDWQTQLFVVIRWLELLGRELQPDLWSLAAGPMDLAPPPQPSRAPAHPWIAGPPMRLDRRPDEPRLASRRSGPRRLGRHRPTLRRWTGLDSRPPGLSTRTKVSGRGGASRRPGVGPSPKRSSRQW